MFRTSLLLMFLLVPSVGSSASISPEYFQRAFCWGFYSGLAPIKFGLSSFLGDVAFPKVDESIAASQDVRSPLIIASESGEITKEEQMSLPYFIVAGSNHADRIKKDLRSSDEFYVELAKNNLKAVTQQCDTLVSNDDFKITPKLGW